MSHPFDLLREDGRLYRISDDELLQAREYLISNPRSGVPRSQTRARRAEVIRFLDLRRHLSELVRYNRLLRGAADPIADLEADGSPQAWRTRCWPPPATMSDLAAEAQALADLLDNYFPCCEDKDFERFEFASTGRTSSLVRRTLDALDYLFHGRSLADLKRDRKALQGLGLSILRWVVGTPGPQEVPHLEEELRLGRSLVIASGNSWCWPAEVALEYEAMFQIYVVLKHQLGEQPVFAVGHWSNASQQLRDEVRSLPIVPANPGSFWRKWFPTGLRRVALPEPPELAEFRMSRRYVRQMKKLKQAASRSKWPLLRRRWISNLRRHAQRLQGQLASLFPELPMPKPTRVRPMKLTVVVNSNEDIPTLEFIPGGFRYAGQVIPLRGKPREVFEKLARSPLKRLTLEIAAKEIWTDGRGVTPENFQKAISQIRAVLMPLIHADQDPIPCIDRGKALAYKLELPYVLAKP